MVPLSPNNASSSSPESANREFPTGVLVGAGLLENGKAAQISTGAAPLSAVHSSRVQSVTDYLQAVHYLRVVHSIVNRTSKCGQ